MLKKKCAPMGLVIATAAGALLSGAPAYAQSDLVQYWHHNSIRVYHRHSHFNLNRNRPRIFIRIYIYNRNNNVAIAGQRGQQQQRQAEPATTPGVDGAADRDPVLGEPSSFRRSGLTGALGTTRTARLLPAVQPSPADRPYIVRDQQAPGTGRTAPKSDQAAKAAPPAPKSDQAAKAAPPAPKADEQATTRHDQSTPAGDPGVVRHDPEGVQSVPDSAWPAAVSTV